eukprot:TRINITY_DN14887_c0_g2_i1.p1 TRINITY_DN14887_c0_g2~~TRINITY_DN14887_c0_g2_i1.p1  ORF type:complete len:888 (-),score=264.42 TRINITY_DN14887_c0_g2_i1:46-2709(-)
MAYRVLLPSDVLPTRYDLTLEPDLDRFTFDGLVKIHCDVAVATDSISVHAKQLVISDASFTPTGGKPMEACEITMKVKDMTATFGFAEVLPVGTGILEVKFRGTLNDQMAGFYRSKYTNSKGEAKHMACTQFEAIDARRCFPCWDEPARKAIFDVTIIYDGKLTALSNMPPKRAEILKDGRRREEFMPTPKMSTYLLAFCVGEFEYISGQSEGGTIARIYCMPGSLEKCHFALRTCIRALDFYNEFFAIPYPLPKMDMIAIPDFSAGAMENWGLVTYREVALLCDEKTVSSVQKQRIASVITHELAHQWFGNLVTMGWWDDLWLNEGFANWMQTFAADALHPEWNIWESYVGKEQQQALSLDSLRSSHPIQVPIKKAEEVEEVFDAISYCKGGSVVRMIFAVLGKEKFQEGLRLYFKRHQYSNTETTDLWKAWAEASGKPIEQMMQSWTQQMGFPVVKIISDPGSQGDGSELEIEQRWFLADGSNEPGDAEKQWMIPILAGSESGAEPVTFMEPGGGARKVKCANSLKGKAWLKLNYGQHVPVRVLYPAGMLANLVKNMSALPAEDRIGLLSDSFALCKAGSLEANALLSVLGGLAGEGNDKVWSEIGSVLAGLEKVVGQGLDASTASSFKELAAHLVAPAFKSVGWDAAASDDDNQKMLRSILVGALAKFCDKDEAIAAEARKRCDAFLAAPNDTAVLSADIRAAVLGLAVKSCTSAELFDRIEKAHDEATDGAVRIHMYGAVGLAPTDALRQRALNWCLTDSVRSQDLIYIPASMAANGREGAEAVFAWVQKDYDRIYARLGETSMILFQHVAKISGSGFVTAERAAEVDSFWRSKPIFSKLEKAIAQTVEAIKNSAKFVERLKASEKAMLEETTKMVSALRSKA